MKNSKASKKQFVFKVAALFLFLWTVVSGGTIVSAQCNQYEILTQSVSPYEFGTGGYTCEYNYPYTQHRDTSVWRSYNISENTTFSGVKFGVQSSNGNNPVIVRIYEDTDGGSPSHTSTLNLLLESETIVPPGAEQFHCVEFDNPLSLIAGTVVVIELFTPDTNSGYLIMGRNSLGETGQSYISAPACGENQPEATFSHLLLHMLVGEPQCGQYETLTHSVDPVSMPDGLICADASWFRSYSISEDTVFAGIEFGVYESNYSQPVVVRIYEDPDGGAPNVTAMMNLLLETETTVLPGNRELHCVGFANPLSLMAGTSVVIELFTPEQANGPLPIGINGNGETAPGYVYAPNCGINGITSLSSLNSSWHLLIHMKVLADCNGNGITDTEDVAAGTSDDCDGDLVPDECQGSSDDCDGNGIANYCEIIGGAQDCNFNGIPDNCDISSDFSIDCDGNGVIDVCEIDIEGHDCNGNEELDACENEPDTDGDGIIDECDVDIDGDGIPNSCDIDFTAGLDCDSDGQDDSCQEDTDSDGNIDVCDDDIDGDGVLNSCDVDQTGGSDLNGDGVDDDCQQTLFKRGDSNADGGFDIGDAISTLGYLFGGESISCIDAADANDDGQVDIADAINKLGVLFSGSTPLPTPGSSECGADPTDDNLECESYNAC